MTGPDLPLLTADCSACAALCCVLLPYSSSAGFGSDKPAGVPCHHLRTDDLCGIHDRLRPSGWPGCVAFDCFGAGQQLTRVTYAGRSWRDPGTDRAEMAEALSVMRLLHESLHHLGEVTRRSPAGVPTAVALTRRLLDLTVLPPGELLAVDLGPVQQEVSGALREASAVLRSRWPQRAMSRADLAGRDLRRQDLRGADLRGSLLMAADLRRCDLTDTDLLGADLRDADVRGADLSGALFLTRPQVAVARGDARTALPAGYERPAHWPGATALNDSGATALNDSGATAPGTA